MAETRQQVDAFHRAALEAGGRTFRPANRTGAFAIGFDYREQQFGFQFSAPAIRA